MTPPVLSEGAQDTGPDIFLKVSDLTKKFPLVLANDCISFDVRKGEIHCLLGENGAGKSTLAECLYGFYLPDSGELIINDRKTNINSPLDAINLGIGMVHQHFMLVEVLSVIENVMLGIHKKEVFLDYSEVEAKLDVYASLTG